MRQRFWLVAYAGVGVFAPLFVWFTGHRGVFLLDQSIMFDGAWRILQGQSPYRDFFSAFPPVAFLVQALFFKAAGVTFSSMVLAAAVLNTVGAICVILLIRTLLPKQPFLALFGGILTALWFQAPFGTLWFEQTAFTLNIVALTLLVRSGFDGRSAVPVRIVAGALMVASMLSKQNAGVEFIPVLAGAGAIHYRDNRAKAVAVVLQIGIGFVIAVAVFISWLALYSSPAGFWHDYIVMARQIGTSRVGANSQLLLYSLFGTLDRCALPLALLLISLFIRREGTASLPDKALLVWIVSGSVVYQNLFAFHTFNEVENCLPYLGLIYGLSVGLFVEGFWNWAFVHGSRNYVGRMALVSIAVMSIALPLYDGAVTSWSRKVQQFAPGDRFLPIDVVGMSGVYWGEPTIITPPYVAERSEIRREDFEALNAWLARADVNFFVFKDSVLLYGLHHRISPQPWLYFAPGHGFLRDELPRVDAVVVESLRRNNVQAVVIEKKSWNTDANLWMQMPRLRHWIQEDFEKAAEFGIYDVYRRAGS